MIFFKFLYKKLLKMVIFEIFQRPKSDPNIHQNALNCTIKKKLGGGGTCPQTPLANVI